MKVNRTVFLLLALMLRSVEMNFVKAEYGFGEDDFGKVDNFDLPNSLRPLLLFKVKQNNCFKELYALDSCNQYWNPSFGVLCKETIKGDLELRKKEEGGFDLKDFYNAGDSLCQGHIDKYNNLLQAIDNYVQRYVSLFLISSKLHNFIPEDSNQIINADLEVLMSGEDLAFLQAYSKSRIGSSILRDLTRLDDMFEKSIKFKENSFMKETLKAAKCLFNFDLSYFYQFKQFYLYPVSFLLIVAVNWYFFWYPFRRFQVILLVVNSFILWEGFIKYFKKLKHADLENMARLRQYDCNTETRSWYQSITNWIYGDKCLQYYKAINHNSVEDVFLLDSIINAYAFYLVRTPFKILGSSLADLTGEITSSLPWPLNWLFYVPILTFFVVIFFLYLLILRGTSLRLSLYGCGLALEKNPSATAGPAASTSSIKPGSALPARKLKGLISSKYPRRLDVIAAVVRRRKNSRVANEIQEGTSYSERRDQIDDETTTTTTTTTTIAQQS